MSDTEIDESSETGRPSGSVKLAKPNIGVNYDTDWTRTKTMTVVRNLAFGLIIGPIARFICSPSVTGLENFAGEQQPLIFAPNHVSHFDTLAFLCAIPNRYRKKMVVAAAVDNFFNTRTKCIFYSLFLGTIPVERTRTNRKSADIAAKLLDAGYNLLIFPEGGRSYTEVMMEFRPGVGYLARRCDVAVTPVYLKGVRNILPKGSSRVRRHPIEVTCGSPLRLLVATETDKAEDARRFTVRLQLAVASLGAPISAP